MDKSKAMILCAAALSLAVWGASDLAVSAQSKTLSLENKTKQTKKDIQTPAIKNLVNIKEEQDVNEQGLNNEIPVGNKVYTAKVTRDHTEIEDFFRPPFLK